MNLLAYVHLRNIYRSTGVGRVARELTEHLARRPEIDLEILADRRDHAEILPLVGPPWTDFRYRLFPHETSRQQALWYALDAPPAEHFWPEVQIVYCPAESYVPTRQGRLVVTSHDMQLFDAGAHALSRSLLQQRFKWWLLFHQLAKKADLFHAISTFSAERLAHYFPRTRDRIRVIPNAVSQAFFKPATPTGSSVLDQLGLRTMPYILLPGGLHFRKNADLILKAWPLLLERCPDLRLVITSHNSAQYLPAAQALGPSLIFAGFRDEAELVALYSNALIVWFPSRYEGFGMPVLEAMACGAPVVTSNTTSLPEIAGGAAAALLSPDRPGDHVETLAALVDDAAGRDRFGKLGRAHAAQYTWANSEDLLVREFRALL